MEVNINLLPQSNSRREKRVDLLIPILGIIIIAAAVFFLTYSYLNIKDTVRELSENVTVQTTTRDNLRDEYQRKTTGVTEYNYIEKYKQLDQFLNSIYESTIDLHERVKLLLPTNGEVTSYSYLNNGELTLTITFYSKGDSAIFLHRLLNADFIDKAEVESIVSKDDELTSYESIFHIKLNTLAGEKK